MVGICRRLRAACRTMGIASILSSDHITAGSGQRVVGKPAVDRIGITAFQQPLLCHGVCRLAVGNLHHGSTTFTDIGPRVMITMVEQFLPLLIVKVH